jgi:hypothetical protein
LAKRLYTKHRLLSGNAKKEGIDKEAVNQIFSNFNKTPEKYTARKDTKWERIREVSRKVKVKNFKNLKTVIKFFFSQNLSCQFWLF